MKPTDLRGILQYIPRFRDRIFVIAIDGAIIADDNFANILLDVAVLRSLNINVVIVHGASAQIQWLADQDKLTPSNVDGTGITDASTLRLAVTVSNQLTHRLLEGLASCDLRGVTSNGIVAYPLGIIQGVDHLFTGKVEKVDVEMFQSLLQQGFIPVVPPLGFDGEGKTYRVNSDSVAVALAVALKAAKIIYVTTHDQFMIQGQVVRQILAAELETLLKTGKADLPEGLRSKAAHAVMACQARIQRVHVINGKVDEGLLHEVFSNEGIGTLIYANEYAQIRPAKKKDIRHIMQLTKKSMQSEELMKRTRANLEKKLNDYFIYEIDRNVVGCVALHVYPDQAKGELAFLCVSPSHEDQGIGRKMIQFVEAKARESGLSQLIVLSTQSFTYFQSKGGFTEGTTEDLPPKRREKYEQSGRKSKILVKPLK
ncbi:MAG TPA: amino-acid N-acetyltransferase [Verrucomicrobiales bacterium]|nr:amino-acid N-acetyltransferase [Verrucomicrobiales bacterium]